MRLEKLFTRDSSRPRSVAPQPDVTAGALAGCLLIVLSIYPAKIIEFPGVASRGSGALRMPGIAVATSLALIDA